MAGLGATASQLMQLSVLYKHKNGSIKPYYYYHHLEE